MIRYRVLLIGLVLLAFGLAIVGVPPAGAAPSSPQVTPSSAQPPQPPVIDPQRGLPGSPVRVTSPFGARCAAAWDNNPEVSFDCGPNVSNGQPGSTTLTVPVSASPGTHYITVCEASCASISRVVTRSFWHETYPFLVLAVVPDLANQTIAQAQSQLKRAGLKLGNVTGTTADPAARIVFQAPAANSVVDPNGTVDVQVAGAVPSTTPVVSPMPVVSPTPIAGPRPVVLTASTTPSRRPELILAMLLGAGLLLVWVVVDASVRRRHRRRRRRRSRLRMTVSQHARLVDISNTGRSATHVVAIACHRNSTVTSGKALR